MHFGAKSPKQVMEASKEARQTVSKNTKRKIKNDKKLKARRPERQEGNQGEGEPLLKR